MLDLPAEYYLDTVKTVFQDFALPKGRMFVRDQLVRPQAIRDTALLTIEGELDDISGNGQTEAAHALCLNIPRERREHFVAPGVGHYGIFSGRRWREMIFPRVRDFIRKHALGERALSPISELVARSRFFHHGFLHHVARQLRREQLDELVGVAAQVGAALDAQARGARLEQVAGVDGAQQRGRASGRTPSSRGCPRPGRARRRS